MCFVSVNVGALHLCVFCVRLVFFCGRFRVGGLCVVVGFLSVLCVFCVFFVCLGMFVRV